MQHKDVNRARQELERLREISWVRDYVNYDGSSTNGKYGQKGTNSTNIEKVKLARQGN